MEQAIVDELVGNSHGNLVRVKEILEAHPELINAAAVWKETPVEAATQMGNRAIIEYLVSRGAPVDFFTALTLSQTDRVRSDLEAKPELAHSRGVHDLPALYFVTRFETPAPFFAVLSAAWIAITLRLVYRRIERRIGTAIARLIAGISLIDAMVMAASDAGPLLIGLAFLAFGLTLLLQRYVEGT